MESFIARQPIFNQNQSVYAYELLFRSGLENVFNHSNPDQASSKVVTDSFLLLGIENITGGRKAFINITRDILVKDYVDLLPKDITVVEILETVEPDPEVIAACKKLKSAGYLLALDDFVYEERYKPLIALADIVKVDILNTGREERKALIRDFSHLGIRFLAEKVETWEAFQETREMGYTYFQGYFFSKPMILSGKDIPGFKLHYFRLLQEINRPELNFEQTEAIIKREMSLSYKLLRYINSAFFGLRCKVDSIKHALMLLGEKHVKKWASFIAMASMGKDKPEELVVQAIIRAKFCESLASKVGLKSRSEELFLMGMFSLIDAIVDRPLSDILEEMPLADDIKFALLGKENHLRDVYEYTLACERGDWEKFSEQAAKLGIDERGTTQLYMDAVKWGHQSFQGGALTN